MLAGATLSSKGAEDIQSLNPYLEPGTLDLLLRLVGVTMLRANRVGHANRCIGMCVRLLGLVDSALKTKPGSAERTTAEQVLVPKLAQASAALADGLQSQRHFMHEVEASRSEEAADQLATRNATESKVSPAELDGTVRVEYDPRFLIFEFVWNVRCSSFS